ncbi:uncharacterized protein BYT42DRAFT_617411 [Radiomyces spectabilis]|uniref:uncharacterized protein n=1 Tax=Radiomyces spectabilis TaxID=64574 RepID=UPI00221ECF5F|nr:uncharacterized protein BYT42DRAFT_617411 [Radiomyces spectabilis]KAI8369380.1 hypothetical protein BYT42DRAFT_617411 [Radiomyces spectabilis]
MKGADQLEALRSNMLEQHGGEEKVEVNQRHLIDKILARYSAEYVLYRELMQNADDASSSEVEIHFHSENPSGSKSGNTMNLSQKCNKIVFKNNGMTFRPEDWLRLKRIAEGNPDEQKIGAFGVGFYSLFSVCENPFVFSGSQCMAFYFKGDQLFAKRGDVPSNETDQWTSFLMDLREPMEMPDFDEFTKFLTTSMGFTANLRQISVYFDAHRIFTISKRMAAPRAMTLNTKTMSVISPQKLFTITSVEIQKIQLDAEKYSPPRLFSPITNLLTKAKEPEHTIDGLPVEKASIFLRVVGAALGVSVSREYEREMERATKKKPPKTTKFQLVYTGQEELESSEKNSLIFKDLIPFPHQGRIFIGFPTHQTTGCCSHMAARFIPTVERESIDFADRYLSLWNKELLAVGGTLSRIIYNDTMDEINMHYRELIGSEIEVDKLKVDDKLEQIKCMFDKQAAHALQSFTFSPSTPSNIVGRVFEERFFNSSKVPFQIMTSHGVQPITITRLLPRDTWSGKNVAEMLNTFVKTIPTVSPLLMENCKDGLDKLARFGFLQPFGIADVLKELDMRSLTPDEMVACMKWWIECNLGHPSIPEATRQSIDATSTRKFMEAAIVDCDGDKLLQLSGAKWWINPKIIPLDLPVPPDTLPFSISKRFMPTELAQYFNFSELSLLDWVQFIVNEPELEMSPHFAEKILTIISRGYPHCSNKAQAEIAALLHQKKCIPTRFGMKLPEETYYPTVNLFDDLPIVRFENPRAVSEAFLSALGVRKHVDLQLVFDRLLSDGSWSHIELVKYLTTIQSSLTKTEIQRLQETPIFTREGEEPKQKLVQKPTNAVDAQGKPVMETVSKNIYRRYRARDLYVPSATLRNLSLPLIYWNNRWRSSSDEAKFLETLGLNTLPPLSVLLQIASPETGDRPLQNRALAYLIDNHTQYQDVYKSATVDTKFLPCEDGSYVAPKDCFTNPEVRILGFQVLHSDLLGVREKLGVKENPPASRLLEAFLDRIDLDHDKAKRMMEYMASRMGDFTHQHWQTLRTTKFIPVLDKRSAQLDAQKQKQPQTILVKPSQCYFESEQTNFHKELFIYVNFGTLANSFLRNCGVKDEPNTVELATMLVSNPEKFWNLSGGGENYLAVLRQIAGQYSQLSRQSSLLNEMRTKPFLVGLKRSTVSDQASVSSPTPDILSDDEPSTNMDQFVQYQLAKASDIFIADDPIGQQIFSPLSAPMEPLLEEFYTNLGSQKLSKQIAQAYTYNEAIGSTERAEQMTEIIFQRTPIIIYQMLNDNPHRRKELLHDEASIKKRLKVLQAKELKVIRTFKPTGEKDVQSTTACARVSHYTLYISSSGEIDFYDVANALCSFLFTRVRFNDAIVVERYLTASLNSLRRKGVPVDRILNIRKTAQYSSNLPEEPSEPLPSTLTSQQLKRYTQQVLDVFGDCRPDYIQQLLLQERENHVERVIEKLLQEDYPRAPPPVEDENPQPVQPEPNPKESRKSGGHRLLDRLWSWGKPAEPAAPPSEPVKHLDQRPSPAEPPTHQKPKLPDSEKTITPNYTSNIKQNLKRGIHSCKPYSGQQVFSPPRIENVKESSSYCDTTPGHHLMHVSHFLGMEFYVHKDVKPDTVLNQYGQSIRGFITVITALAKLFDLKLSSLHMFYDTSGSTIAFNLSGSLFFNLRYYLALHEPHSKDPREIHAKHKEAAIYWFMTICHELAHNFVGDHSSEHEFYMSSFAEVYLEPLINYLGSLDQPLPNDTLPISSPSSASQPI